MYFLFTMLLNIQDFAISFFSLLHICFLNEFLQSFYCILITIKSLAQTVLINPCYSSLKRKYHKMTRNLRFTSFHSASGINERNYLIICLNKSPGSHPVFNLTTKCLSNQAIFFYTQCHVLKLSPSLIIQVVSLSQALLLHSSILLQQVSLFLFFSLKKLKCYCVSSKSFILSG